LNCEAGENYENANEIKEIYIPVQHKFCIYIY